MRCLLSWLYTPAMRHSAALLVLLVTLSACGTSPETQATSACDAVLTKLLNDPDAKTSSVNTKADGDKAYTVAGDVTWSGGTATYTCTARDGDDGWTASSRDVKVNRQ